MRTIHFPWLSCACLLMQILGSTSSRAGSPGKNSYETGYPALVKITADLYQALEPKRRQQLLPMPVLLKNVAMPYLQPSEYSDGSNTWRAVHISEGFLDLMNNISHARAIDEVDRGYFKKYASSLATETGEQPLAELANITHKKSWDFNTMNHQVSQFNQMAAALIAIDLAHHYLGHYKKYAARLVDAGNRPVPINSLLTLDEWRQAVLNGARNALDCGLGTDGLRTVYDCLDRMPVRPAWAIYFRPPQANSSRIKKELNELEKDFFLADDPSMGKGQRLNF